MDIQGKSTQGRGRTGAKTLGWKVWGSFRKSQEASVVGAK